MRSRGECGVNPILRTDASWLTWSGAHFVLELARWTLTSPRDTFVRIGRGPSSSKRAALAALAQGVRLEAHPKPKRALSDGPRALCFDAFGRLLHRINEV